MDYFKRLQQLLQMERDEDRKQIEKLSTTLPVSERRAMGLSWYPVATRDTEITRGDYLSVEIERTTHQELIHQFRFGMSVALFTQHDAAGSRAEGIITWLSGNRMKITLRTDELPDWSRDGKLGVDALFDENSYREMDFALKLAPQLAEKKEEGYLVRLLTGSYQPHFNLLEGPVPVKGLNPVQEEAVRKILSAENLAIVHGPPGTGKTTTLVQAIRALVKQEGQQVLVTAPSNAAVDLLSEKLAAAGLTVVRIGNPARVSETLQQLTLDGRLQDHPDMKEIRKLRKQASEFRDMAHKYKRNFGRDEREQRKALFAEARAISQQIERTEKYMVDSVLSGAEVITATLVGASHESVRNLRYATVVIDEAGQALEPAAWIPILKGKRVVMAGDHCQLPPTIKSEEAARGGLRETLMEKLVTLHPSAVVLLEEQYRMHEQIMQYPSDVFYGGRLIANAAVRSHQLLPGEAPLAFIDTAGCGFEEKWEGTSISNPEEAAFAVKHLSLLVDRLLAEGGEAGFPSIAVISPYKHQVEVLKELVASREDWQSLRSRIAVNTIDSFQGQERDVVYISMTRSNTDGVIGFLGDTRRMNVAMTRARKKLVVVGDSATLSILPFYADFISYAQANESYFSAWEWM